MKKHILFLILVFFALQNFAQTTPWISSGATWYYKFTSSYMNGNEKIQYINDTTILGKTCQILKISRDNYTVSPPLSLISSSIGYQYTYSNGDTVFYLKPSGFEVLYNFGAVINDTWDLGVDYNYSNCHASIVKVDSLSSISFSGNSHRILYTSDSASSSEGISGKIIEHIGSMEYLFPTGRNCDTSAIIEWFNYSFSCFSDSLESYSVVTASECQNPFHVGINNNEISNSIQIYPNPTENNTTIEFSNSNNYTIRVYSTLGELLLSLKSGNTKTIELDLNAFTQAIYFAEFETDSGKSVVKKIIKK